MSRSDSGETGRLLAMSANCSIPPGRNTRRISAKTRCLSVLRLITPLGDDHVGPAVLDGQRLGEASAELDVSQAEGLGGLLRFADHLVGHVDADDASAGPDLGGGDEGVQPGAAADVDDPLAGLEAAKRKGVAHAGEGFNCPVGQGCEQACVVAEPGRKSPAGVEIEGLACVQRDGAVLAADLVAQRVAIGGLPLRSQFTSRQERCCWAAGHDLMPVVSPRPERGVYTDSPRRSAWPRRPRRRPPARPSPP
jgi:hypothetical protein